jgi:hypothetical protein
MYSTEKAIRPITSFDKAIKTSNPGYSFDNIRIYNHLSEDHNDNRNRQSFSILVPKGDKGGGAAGGGREKQKDKGGKKPSDTGDYKAFMEGIFETFSKIKPGEVPCDKPLSMNKVTSGSFVGGKKVEDYFPGGDIRSPGEKLWDHGDRAGPWDLGTRAGVNIQLYGIIPSQCQSRSFYLDQRYKNTRYRVNGNPTTDEGVTGNDIRESGQDASRPPFRQEWADPWGDYIISMADVPSISYVKAGSYSPGSNLEVDKEFVTSLMPRGSPSEGKSVRWTHSLRIEKGVVTRNDLS